MKDADAYLARLHAFIMPTVMISGSLPHIFHAFGQWWYIRAAAPEQPWINIRAAQFVDRLNDE